MTIVVGQVYASTRGRDIAAGLRQRRRVTDVDLVAGTVCLQSEDGVKRSPPREVRLVYRHGEHKIPGHRLVEDVQ